MPMTEVTLCKLADAQDFAPILLIETGRTLKGTAIGMRIATVIVRRGVMLMDGEVIPKDVGVVLVA